MKKRGYWKSLEEYSKGSVIGIIAGFFICLFLSLVYFKCSDIACYINNFIFFLITSTFLGFLAGFISGFIKNWASMGFHNIPAWEKTGVIFIITNFLVFLGAVYNIFPLNPSLDLFYSFPMKFAQDYLYICYGPDACGTYAFLGFFIWITTVVCLAGSLIGYVSHKLILLLVSGEKEIEYISHKHSKRQKTVSNIIIAMLILSITYIVIFSNLHAVSSDLNFYRSEYPKYSRDVINKEQITADLLNYLENEDKDESLISEFSFSEKEHLKDVKSLTLQSKSMLAIMIMFSILLLIALCILDMWNFIKDIALTLIISGASSVLLLLIFYIWTANFSSAFRIFHSLFFMPGTWEFSSDTLLIRLFPLQFFQDITAAIIGNIMLTSLMLIVTGLIIYLLSKKE